MREECNTLINISFNIRGKPIICILENVYFIHIGIDYLSVIIVEK